MFKKFGDKSKIEVLDDSQSKTIDDFKQKIGKSITDLTDEERDEFRKVLGCCGNSACACKSS